MIRMSAMRLLVKSAVLILVFTGTAKATSLTRLKKQKRMLLKSGISAHNRLINRRGKMSDEKEQTAGQSDQQRVVMCQSFNCDKPATVKLLRSSTCVCDEHHRTNIAQFGCVFELEPVNT